MHISDGVLSTPIWVGSYIISGTIVAVTTRKIQSEDIPKTAIMTSAFFVASLIHVPIGPTSVHLILNGLIGVLLGPLAFISIFLGLTLQAILFQHGGITTIGVNSIMMGIPALLAYKIFDLQEKFCFKSRAPIFGALAGGCGILLGAVILALFLVLTGSEFIGVAKVSIFAHMPVIIIEAILTGFIASFIVKLKPELLRRRKKWGRIQ